MSTIYFTVMGSNERLATVEIREMTVGTWAYTITHSHKAPVFKSTVEHRTGTPLELVTKVLNDYQAYLEEFPKVAGDPTEELQNSS